MYKSIFMLISFLLLTFQSETLFARFNEVKRNNEISRSNDLKYKFQLAACMIFQNEAEFLQEWIEYHKLVGVQHFYLFNNASTDNYKEVLAPYISSGQVELFEKTKVCNTEREFSAVQNGSYNEAIALACHKVKWLIVMDADEFFVPLTKNTLIEVLADYEDAGGVYANWLCFGTSNIVKIPSDRLMIDMLNHCEKSPMNTGKSIVRPERVSHCNHPHQMVYNPPFFHVNTDHKKFDFVCPIADDKLVIYHYYTRDLDHLINIKYPRRKKWINIELNSYIKQLDHLNHLENNTMQRFVPNLKRIMHKN